MEYYAHAHPPKERCYFNLEAIASLYIHNHEVSKHILAHMRLSAE